MKVQEFLATVGTLIDDGEFEGAEKLMKEHAVLVPEEMRRQPFQPPVMFKEEHPPQSVSEADMAIGVFTGLSRRLRNKKYDKKISDDPNRLRILEEGDSWHQYPIFIDDLVDQIAERFAIHSLGYPGDTVNNMVLLGEYETAIRELNPDVFMFGGGGNDLLGEGRFSRVLRPYSSHASAADLIDEISLSNTLNQVLSGYRTILNRAFLAKPGLRIFLHGYDYAIPIEGRRTLARPLAEKGIPIDTGREIIRILIDRFQRDLTRMAAEFGRAVQVFDMRGVVGEKASWFDELHPKSAGFGRCAAEVIEALTDLEKYVDQLRAGGETSVVEAVGIPLPGRGDGTLYDVLMRRSSGIDPLVQRSVRAGGGHASDAISHMRFSLEEAQAQAEVLDLIARFDEPEPEARIDSRISYSKLHRGSAFEAIIGNADFDPYHVLPKGVDVARSVARITVRGRDGVQGYGTGFLIAPNLLLTNNHVLDSSELAATSIASFEYHENEDGSPNMPSQFRLTGDPFVTSASHDYSIVGIEPVSMEGRPVSDFGHITLLPRSGKALKSENINIIQHPRGGFKQVALRKNLVIGRAAQFIYYTADTLPGSSGAPVFNTEWQLVAIHHMAIRDPKKPGQFLSNRGIRISALMDDLNHRRSLGDADAIAVDQALFETATRNVSLGHDISAPLSDAAGITSEPGAESDGWEEVFDRSPIPPLAEFEAARPPLSASAARWPSRPENAPDTWHMADQPAAPFSLTSQVLTNMVSAGRYEPHDGGHGKVIIGLRGCRIVGGRDRVEDASAVDLEPAVVDHENTRCVIGVWHRGTGRLSLYSGSTVPRRTQMLNYYNKVNFGTSLVYCNMLPTGLYEYCVGSHFSRTNGEITFVLRQGNGPMPVNAGTVTTLRTYNDLTYGTRDFWDKCEPSDNIHPAFLNTSFSSQGCLTLPGTQSGNGAPHTTGNGLWSRFRRAAGFDGQRHGVRYDLILSTGHEASIVAQNGAGTPLCLRHGSHGAEVRRLQQSLGVTVDGHFGPATKKALTERQNNVLGFATGTWTPKMADAMSMTF